MTYERNHFWKLTETPRLSKADRERLDGMESDDIAESVLTPYNKYIANCIYNITKDITPDAIETHITMLHELTEYVNAVAEYLLMRQQSDYEF